MTSISYLINGISLGSVYAIIALGYTMVYGIAKMLNFAHGDVIMVGAYIVLTCVTGAGMNPFVAIIIATIACTIFGVVIEAVAYRPLRNAASPLAVLTTAIGVSYLLQNLALLIFGSNTKSFPEVIKLPNLKLAGGKLTITGTTILTIVLCIVIMAALMLFINKTKAGQAMLAVSEDKGAAQLMGINVNKTALLCIPKSDTLYRFHAWYQGIRSSCIRRNRFCTGSADWRNYSWNHRDSRKSIHFLTACRCNRICSSDRGTSCKAYWNSWQEYPGESVGGRNVKEYEENNKEQYDYIPDGHCRLCSTSGTCYKRKPFQLVYWITCTNLYLYHSGNFIEPGRRLSWGTEPWTCRIHVCRSIYKCIFLKMYERCD